MNTDTKRLYRSRVDRVFGGVCGGLGEFFVLDPTLIRLIFALGTIFGFGSFLLVYIVMLVVVPENPNQAPAPTIVPASPAVPSEEPKTE
ncbi:MAG: PspC domain-containing protein [Omnitrophica WOR_2 bacterium]